LYGTANGNFGVIKFDASCQAELMWEVQGKQPVSCVAAYDLTKDGVQDVLIGREDGTLEIYSFDISSTPSKVFDRNVEESITSIQIGYVTSANTQDIILTTFSGKIIAYAVDQQTNSSRVEDNVLVGKVLTTMSSLTGVLSKPFGSTKSLEDATVKPVKVVGLKLEEKIAQLKKEITTLEIQNAEARARYSNLTEEMIAVSCKYNIKTSFTLIPEIASYRLSFELDCPIDIIACRSDVQLELMDIETQGFVLSNIPCDPKSDGSHFKAAFRCSENSKKLDILVCTNIVTFLCTKL